MVEDPDPGYREVGKLTPIIVVGPPEEPMGASTSESVSGCNACGSVVFDPDAHDTCCTGKRHKPW